MAQFDYRPSIDGLRAIAVIAVLLFHIDRRLLPGGFVGVDVFFVVSGYLITLVITSECKSGTFSMGRFYQRRIARIFPASAIVCLATLAAAIWIYMPEDCGSVGATVCAAALSIANLKVMRVGDYFEISPDAQPLLHYWTLGVEEQFYLLLPALVLLLFRRTHGRLWFVWMLAAAAISFAACLALTYSRPRMAFYLLPTRAWELLVGSALAVSPLKDGLRKCSRISLTLAVIGVTLIAVSFAVINETIAFPGVAATLPVAGTLLAIIGTTNGANLISWSLTRPAFRFIGQVSYSLYLWHWPVLCFVDYALFTTSNIARLLLKIVLIAIFALSSYWFFEVPLRRYLNRPEFRLRAYAAFAAGVVLLVALGAVVREDHDVTANARLDKVRSGGVKLNAEDGRPTIVLVGDSNASMYGSVVQDIAVDLRVTAHSLGVPHNDPMPGSPLFKETIAYLDEHPADVIVFVGRWSIRFDGGVKDFDDAIVEFGARARGVVLITQPPELPETASRAAFRQTGWRQVFETDETRSKRLSANLHVKSREGPGILAVDIESLFVDSSGAIRFIDDDGKQLYRDSTHLSGFGTALVRQPLENALRQVLESADLTARQVQVDPPIAHMAQSP